MSSSIQNELLPWQQQHYADFCSWEAHKRLAHAYLLEGLEGIGKRSFARHFAHRILCHHPVSDMPCGECTACHLYAAGTHPDLWEIVPEENKRDISIDQIRKLLSFMANKSMHGGRKVIILAPVEEMNINAANALLKGLEEPASGTLLLLVSHQPGLLMATIRSRCQAIRMTVPGMQEAAAWLQSKKVEGSAEELLRMANGAPLRALALADQEAQHERSVLHEVLYKLIAGEINLFTAASTCQAFSIEENVEGMTLCVNDLLVHLQTEKQSSLREAGLANLASKMQGEQCIQLLHQFYLELIASKKALISKTNPNSQLMLESLFGRWQQLKKEI